MGDIVPHSKKKIKNSIYLAQFRATLHAAKFTGQIFYAIKIAFIVFNSFLNDITDGTLRIECGMLFQLWAPYKFDHNKI